MKYESYHGTVDVKTIRTISALKHLSNEQCAQLIGEMNQRTWPSCVDLPGRDNEEAYQKVLWLVKRGREMI